MTVHVKRYHKSAKKFVHIMHMVDQHGGVLSAVTGRAKVFRGFKLVSHVLGSLASSPYDWKKEKC